MCGIFGAITKAGLEDKELRAVSEALSLRGPDDEGFARLELSGKVIDLVHRRLSIIELSIRGHQPMSNDGGTLWIVYNGEVYNFRELKNELIEKGYKFHSDCDTEVVIKSYQEWGIDCVHKFIGMFAFAIIDKIKNKLFLFRDHVGVKPIYYYDYNGTFMFASELKSFMRLPGFKKEIDTNSLYLYLLFGYIPSPYAIFKNTYKLEPGFILEKDLSGPIKKIKWWDVFGQYEKEKFNFSFNQAKEALKEKLLRSFQYRMVSDVPVGVFLSGGIDSTVVTTLLQKNTASSLKTFTIGFSEKEYNEAQWAKRIAGYLGTEHTEFFCTPKEAFGVIKEMPFIYDEPFADSSGIPTYLVSRLSRQYVKVCLSGDGGDELFGGYDRYALITKFLPFLKLPPRIKELLLGFLTNLPLWFYQKTRKQFTPDKFLKLRGILNATRLEDAYLNQVFYWTPDEIGKILNDFGPRVPLGLLNESIPAHISNKEKAMAWDFHYYLSDDLLAKVDRASMHTSLEARDPFVDKDLSEFAIRLPLSYRFNKRILKSILRDYLPAEYFLRPKQGFGVPIYEWFRQDLKEIFYQYLSKPKLEQHGFFNSDYIISILDEYIKSGNIAVHKLWGVLVFQMWYEEWVSG